MPAFKDMLIDAMKTKGLSGLALAKLSGCSQTSVSFATTGKDAPNEETIKKWVEILGISEGDSGDWLSSAALQRAQRSDIPARSGESRLADKINYLEKYGEERAQAERRAIFMAFALLRKFMPAQAEEIISDWRQWPDDQEKAAEFLRALLDSQVRPSSP